jgi:hypothetical protein
MMQYTDDEAWKGGILLPRCTCGYKIGEDPYITGYYDGIKYENARVLALANEAVARAGTGAWSLNAEVALLALMQLREAIERGEQPREQKP